MEILGELRRDFTILKDNLKLTDVDVAIEELRKFKKAGGNSLVDVTSFGPRTLNDPRVIREISEKTGLTIIVSTGCYIKKVHPPMVHEKNADELSELMVHELCEEIQGTGIKAGVIGELGCSFPFHPDEEKVMRAAARAQIKTHAGIIIHPGLYDRTARRMVKPAESYLDLLEKEGADLKKVCISHMDFTSTDLAYHKQVLDRGTSIMYDTFGCDIYRDDIWPGCAYPTDTQRVAGVTELCRQGYDKQLMLSTDTCIKTQTAAYGGYGYAHILQHIVPCLEYNGVTDGQIKNMVVENPKRLLQI
jgi:phosphotriesterase-related protein